MRITSQYVEVAGQNTDGNLVVTRAYASVLMTRNLSTIYEETVNHTLNFTSIGRNANIKESVTSAASFTQNVVVLREFIEDVSHTIVFVDHVDRANPASANTAITLTDVVDIEFILEDRKGASNTLAFIQDASCLQALSVSDTLSLVDTVNVTQSTLRESISHWLGFTQNLPTPHRGIVEDTLDFTSLASVPITRTATSTMNLEDVASMTTPKDVIAFVQTVGYGKWKEVEQELELDDSVFVQGNWNRLVTDDLEIGHALTWFLPQPCTPKSYSPFQGENTITTDFAQPSDTLPSIYSSAATDRFTLYYPSHAAILRTLVLRAPEMDNRDTSQHTRVNRETRGGYLIVYADPAWPTIRTLSVTIIGVCASDVELYLDFISETLGKEIEIRDWEGYLWRGVIVDPENPVTQEGPDNFTIAFALEGEVLTSTLPEGLDEGYALNLTQTVSYIVE